MAGGWVLAAYLALGLGVGCQAFYVRPSPAVATPTASRETRARGGHVSGRPNPNRAYQRADWQDCGQTMRRFSGSSESGSSGLSTEGEGTR